jgi:MarR family transcriptional regulator, transcriptional regulator for hemolysin
VATPDIEPIGRHLARTARAVSRAFDDALAKAGGSLPQWLILASLKDTTHGMQRQLADALGIEGPTLTHHLNKMEAAGLVTRERDPANRRVHHVELTPAGQRMFSGLRDTVVAFDARLRSGLTDRQLSQLRRLLDQLAVNVATPEKAAPVPQTSTPASVLPET